MVNCRVCNLFPISPHTYKSDLCDECASYAAHAVGVIERQLKGRPYDFDRVMQRFCQLTLSPDGGVEMWKVVDGFIAREVSSAIENDEQRDDRQPQERTSYLDSRGFNDWYSTAPRMSGSSRLTEDGHVVKKNGYN